MRLRVAASAHCDEHDEADKATDHAEGDHDAEGPVGQRDVRLEFDAVGVDLLTQHILVRGLQGGLRAVLAMVGVLVDLIALELVDALDLRAPLAVTEEAEHAGYLESPHLLRAVLVADGQH